MAIGSLHSIAWPVRAAVAAVLGSALSLPVVAAQAQGGDDETELAEVEVTGTRIQQGGAYTAPNPVTTITGDELKRLGVVNVADAITTLLPQNISDIQPDNVGLSSFFVGSTVANLRGLNPSNGIFTTGSRTLTMVDGRRVVSSSNQADVVDMNMIPSNLLQRMDVVTGGASAAYGSGAMAGVVNLVLNNRLKGVNLDLDYGVNEVGDGASKHISISGGTPVLGGKGHILASAEWQDTAGIYDCSADRAWCREGRGLFVNAVDPNLAPGSLFQALPGYEDMPLRFQVTGLRRSQWSPNSAIALDNVDFTSGYKFNDAGTGIVPYTTGYRGGGSRGGNVLDGDGPINTYKSTLSAANDRKTLFTHFEYDFTEKFTGYAEANFSRSGGTNPQYFTTESHCIRFNTPGVAQQVGRTYPAGTRIYFFGAPTGGVTYGAIAGVAGFSQHVGVYVFPTGPVQNAQQLINATWDAGGLTLNVPFTAPDIPAVAPTLGANANAFLSTLSPEAIAELQRAASTRRNPNTSTSGNLPTAGENQDGQLIFRGANACAGHAGIFKVWNPQVEQKTERDSETLRGVLGFKGRFGSTWRFDGYYQYGETTSENLQYDSRTSLRLAFALDSVIDNRATVNGQANPTFNQPVCRYVRDGLPTVTSGGDQLSNYDEMAALLQGCVALNPFGQAASQEALDYAFREMRSKGKNTLDVLAINTSGTLIDAWAGPLTGAFGLEFRKDTVNNAGSMGNEIERLDFKYNWGDAFGGTTKVFEQFAELNLPLVSGVPGVNLWSINGAVRRGTYKNEGGVGTTGESGTQKVTNWKFSTIFEPFDWVRLRMSRSRDLRAAGYRELYNNSPGVPDSATTDNYWRAYNPTSTTGRQDRYTSVFGGNPDLKPEKSDTLTVGLVLSPGGWAQGMRITADYYDIKVKDGLQPNYDNPVQACWEASGNQDPVVQDGVVVEPEINGLFDADNEFCKRITFGDPDPESAGTPFAQYSNIVSYGSSYMNAEPFQTRGVDLEWSYLFGLTDLIDGAPGSVSLRIRANRALEASGLVSPIFRAFLPNPEVDYVGQLSSGLGFVPGIQPTPKWSGNIMTSYMQGPLTVTLSARYVGGAKIDKVYYADTVGQAYYQDADGNFLVGSIDDNSVKPYMNFALNGSYDLKLGNMKQFQVFGSINNLFDKDPPYTGGFLAGVNPQFHDTRGRAYRMGVRMRF